ncbi:hypothetical protein BKI52_03285 [marine bacterium AO1-C]|nr:hypothetical protein BKI52_03285 [marine bacterium AO1-C]
MSNCNKESKSWKTNNTITMHKFFKIIFGLTWLISSQVVWGQQPNCPNPQIEEVICSSKDWNWETSTTSNEHCATWTARASTGAIFMGNPWENASGTISNIANKKDYQHSKGWELIRRDFGCARPTDYPWFILYNKYNGLMRVYVYLGVAENTFSRIVGVLEHASGQKNSSIVAHSKSQARSADAYLNESIGDEEIILHEAGALGPLNWGVMQYRPTLDPHITNSAYQNTEFSVKIYGYNESNVNLNGESITQAYSIAGNRGDINTSSSGSAINTFTAKSQKVLKYVGSIDKYREELNKDAVKHRDKTDNQFVKKVLSDVVDITDSKSKFSKTLGTISSVAKAAGGIIGVIGSIVDFFTDAAPTPPVPTISNYNFTGSITTSHALSTFQVKHPGSIQTNDNNQPYYNYPLGVCNLKNTPRLHHINYARYTGHNSFTNCTSTVPTFRSYSSYKVMDDLQVYYNAPAGLEVVSAQAAIVGRIKTNNKNGDPALSPSYLTRPGLFACITPYKNHMYDAFNAGRMVINSFNTDDFMLEFQTPFVDIACFKGMTFNVFKETDVFVRLKVVLKKAGQNNTTTVPLLFVQDYAINKQDVGLQEADNANYYLHSFNTLPPFANHHIPNTTVAPDVNVAGIDWIYSGKLEAANSITVSNSSVNLFINGSSFNMQAENYIDLKEDFEVGGTIRDFTAVAGGGYLIKCGDQKPIALTGTFGYNNGDEGMRTTRSQVTTNQASVPTRPLVFPNPTARTLFVKFPKSQENLQVSLIDQQGKSVLQKSYTQSIQMLELQVKNLSEGLYFLHLKSPEGALEVHKVVIKR